MKGIVTISDLANELEIHPGALREYALSIGMNPGTITGPETQGRRVPYVTNGEAALLRKALAGRKLEEIQVLNEEGSEPGE